MALLVIYAQELQHALPVTKPFVPSVLEQKINAKHVHKDMSLMDLMVVKFALQMQCVQAVK